MQTRHIGQTCGMQVEATYFREAIMNKLYEGAEALIKFDEYEMHPVAALDADGELIKSNDFRQKVVFDLEQCDENDPDIYCWSVYGHLPEIWSESETTGRHLEQAGVECLADCPTKEIALAILSVLRSTL